MEIENKPKTRGNPNWKKGGKSPNPGGRPKSKNYAEAARKWLDANADELVEKHGAAALGKKPDLAAARMLVEYAEGKARQNVDLTIDDRIRPALEAGIETLIKTGLSEEEAKAYLARFVPEVEEWIH
jgi:hypothetical protein